jgi:hypothetical protein
MNVVKSITFSILFNGKIGGIHTNKGDPPGRPNLTISVFASSTSENLLGIIVAPTAPMVNHLLFADDSLLFLNVNMEGATTITKVIDAYCVLRRVNE